MKKIMFNARYGLTKAVLEGRKTMMRRLVPHGTPLGNWEDTEKKSRYKVCEVVAVAQSYKEVYWPYVLPNIPAKSPGWNNKMIVSADLMPHQIRITNIRVERLQDISEEDCYREGIYKKTLCPPGDIDYFYHSEPRSKWEVYPSTREAFADLIDKVSGKGTWGSNPWVFVYEFELVK